MIWQIGVCDVIPPAYYPSLPCEGASRRYVAAFFCGDFWATSFTYLEFDGNEVSLARLKAIADFNRGKNGCDVYILNYDAPLSESVVSDLLTAAKGEGLRSLLNAHVPAPFPNGWEDCNKWTVRYARQYKRGGQLALLPRESPAAYEYLSYLETGWENYPERLVGFFLHEYIRPWQQSVWRPWQQSEWRQWQQSA